MSWDHFYRAKNSSLTIVMFPAGMSGVDLPPATSPDSPSWMATPNPPSFTGAEFSLDASRTQ